LKTDETVSLAEAVGRRFDSIFGPDDDTQEIKVPNAQQPPPPVQPPPPLSPPVRDLKSIVLSVEWEITDQLLERYEQQVVTLEDIYKTDTVMSQFLKILKALGRHVQARKALAHPESIKLMSVVFERFESVVVDEEMPADDKRRLLKSSVADFQELKQQISDQAKQRRAERKAAEQPPTAEVEQPVLPEPAVPSDMAETVLLQPGPEMPKPADYSGMTPHEAFAFAVEELKEVIRAEFRALRAEIKMWREGQ
jgi:hypothetical protein